jgi:hypothetical protein
LITITPEFQPDLFQPTEPPHGMLPTTLQPQTVSLLSELLLKIIETAPIVLAEEETTDE